MGKRDTASHKLHIPKQLKFKQLAPSVPNNAATAHAPQEPKVGTSDKNQYR
jgi:hypothetical protein